MLVATHLAMIMSIVPSWRCDSANCQDGLINDIEDGFWATWSPDNAIQMPPIEFFCDAGSLTYDGVVEWVFDADLGLSSFAIGRTSAQTELRGPISARITDDGGTTVFLSNPTFSNQRLHLTYGEGTRDVLFDGQSTGVRTLGVLQSLFVDGAFWSDSSIQVTVALRPTPRGTTWSCLFRTAAGSVRGSSSSSVAVEVPIDVGHVIDGLDGLTRGVFDEAVIGAIF